MKTNKTFWVILMGVAACSLSGVQLLSDVDVDEVDCDSCNCNCNYREKNAEERMKTKLEGLRDEARDKKEELEERTKDKAKQLRDKAGKAVEETKGKIATGVEKIKQKGQEVKGKIKEGMHDVAEKIKKATGVLEAGDFAPGFSLKDEMGKIRTLEEFRGRRIVLYFYPMDDTPGCTKQACSLRDSYSAFEKNNIVVIGINYSSVKSHKNFKGKLNLPFILLSDYKKKVAKAYGAKSAWIIIPQRKTYLIDEEGIIKDIISDVDPSTHTKLVLERFGVRQE